MNPTQNQPTTTGVDAPAQVLRDAALYLERHGWTQGLLYADHLAVIPPACAIGAIHYALFGGPIVTATSDQLTQAGPVVGVLADHIHDAPADTDWGDTPTAVVTDWNDAHGRTAADVIATLRAAADEWDRIHGGAR